MLSLVFVCLCVLAADATNQPIRDSYIINGRPSEQGKFPWQVSLQRIRDDGTFRHGCGGALLTADWVLTASHCVMLSDYPEDYKVRVGAFQLSADDHADEIDVAEIVYHPDFVLIVPGIPNDIALLRLVRSADLSHPNVGVVSLPSPDNDFSQEDNCFISGWGRNDRDSDFAADVLQESPIGVLTNAQCALEYDDLLDVTPVLPDHICIDSQGPDGVHACHGDSGGPLECQVNGEWVIAGVASRTGLLNCGDLGYPSVYIRVTEHLDFIRQHVPGV